MTKVNIDGQEIIVASVGEIDELIEQYNEQEPKNSKSEEHRKWRKTYLSLLKTANQLAGFKRYKESFN